MTCYTSAADDESYDDDKDTEDMVRGTSKIDKTIECNSCGKDGNAELTTIIEEVGV